MISFDFPRNGSTTEGPKNIESEGSSIFLKVVMCILALFSIFGTIGNALVIFVYIRRRSKLTSTIFMKALACTDMFTCIIIIPFTMAMENLKFHVKYDFICKLYMLLITTHVPLSAFIMVAVAIDRYLSICYPFRRILNASRAKCLLLLLVIITLILGIITSLNYGTYKWQPKHTNDYLEAMTYDERYNNSSNMINYIESLTKSHNISINELLTHIKQDELVLANTGICSTNGIVFSEHFTNVYQKIYSGIFIIVLGAVLILYALIYKYVIGRRARRRRMRNGFSGQSSYKETDLSPLQTRVLSSNGRVQVALDLKRMNLSPTTSNKSDDSSVFKREKTIVANIRTACILFTVTVVFIIAFLPAWLMAHQLIPYNIVIFYMYFIYNVANPIIYAFMNKTFRRDLHQMFRFKGFK